MILHTVNQSPSRSQALASCLRAALPGSHLLLLEDGVYAARANSSSARQLQALPDIRCYVLLEDARTRGIQDTLASGLQTISYADFVRLSVECHAVQSWYN